MRDFLVLVIQSLCGEKYAIDLLVFTGFTGIYWNLLVFTGFTGFTGIYWIYWNLLELTGFTGIYWNLLDLLVSTCLQLKMYILQYNLCSCCIWYSWLSCSAE